MADVLEETQAASTREAKKGSNRAKQRHPTQQASGRSARQPATRQPPERKPPARRPAPREPPARASPEDRPVRGRRQKSNRPELENPSLDDIDDPEAPHGPYDTVGSIQRGVDMFRAGDATPDVFMPHLAAHGEYTHHLALPYNMEHVHPSLYQGAPLIRGFPAHDSILERMQQNHRENYPGR